MRRRSLRNVGIALAVLGAVVLLSPTLGFQTLEADRSVTADTASDPNALLGVIDNSDTAEADVTTDSSGVPYLLDDNHGAFDVDEVTATAVAFDGQPTNLQANVTGDPGTNDFRLEVSCGNSALDGSGTLTVAIDAADSVSIGLERTTNQPVSVDCRSESGTGFTGTGATSIYSQETSQTFTFTPGGQLPSDATVVIDLSGPQNGAVDYSSATVVDAGGGSATFEDSSTLVYTPDATSSGEVSIEVDGVQTEQDISGYSVEFVRTDTYATGQANFFVFWLDWG